jgi:hypothetical protein
MPNGFIGLPASVENQVGFHPCSSPTRRTTVTTSVNTPNTSNIGSTLGR